MYNQITQTAKRETLWRAKSEETHNYVRIELGRTSALLRRRMFRVAQIAMPLDATAQFGSIPPRLRIPRPAERLM